MAIQISFNTADLTENDVRVLQEMAKALAWKDVAVSCREKQRPLSEGAKAILALGALPGAPDNPHPYAPQPDPSALQEMVDAADTLHAQDLLDALAAPPPAEEKAPRKRRTKAEMEADAAKAAAPAPVTSEPFNRQLALLNDQLDAGHIPTEKRRAACKEWEARYTADPEQAMKDIAEVLEQNTAHLARVEEITKATPLHSYTTEELRPMLQDFTEAQGMQEGLDLLKEFGCQRISEVAALTPEKQAEFVGKLNA